MLSGAGTGWAKTGVGLFFGLLLVIVFVISNFVHVSYSQVPSPWLP